MSHLHGIFIKETLIPNSTEFPVLVKLNEADDSAMAHLKALRISNHQPFYLLNGKGLLAKTQIKDLKKRELEILEITQQPTILPGIKIYLSSPKGDDLERCLQFSTELGAQDIYLFRSKHCTLTKLPNLGRLNRIVEASCEQSLNAFCPNIHSLFDLSLNQILQNLDPSGRNLVFDEDLAEHGSKWFKVPLNHKVISLFVGPEGGWSDEERLLFRNANITSCSLGPRVLKVPTALNSALSIIRHGYAQ